MAVKFSIFPNKIKNTYQFWRLLLVSYFIQLKNIRSNIKQYQYKFANITETNLLLGVHHLENGRINDAILRFKIINKFFSPQNDLANYWLGWCYYLKGNLENAISYLTLSNIVPAKELLYFLQNIDVVTCVPKEIWSEQRKLANYRTSKNIIYTNNFASSLVRLLIKSIPQLPIECRVLELGYTNYHLARELKRRLSQVMEITIVETAVPIGNDLKLNYTEYYDNIILCEKLDSFITKNKNKFDLIYSCISISYLSNLDTFLAKLTNSLHQYGYFMLITYTDYNIQVSKYSLSTKTYLYNHDYLKKLFNINDFSIIYSGRLSLGINGNFSIIIGQKN